MRAMQQAKEGGRIGEASAEAGTRTEATSTKQKQQGTYSMRRLRGKQTPVAVTAFARAAQVALEQTKKAANEAIEAAKAAKQDATVALEQTKKTEARLADAIDYADRLQSRYRSVVRVPPFLG